MDDHEGVFKHAGNLFSFFFWYVAALRLFSLAEHTSRMGEENQQLSLRQLVFWATWFGWNLGMLNRIYTLYPDKEPQFWERYHASIRVEGR